MYNQVILIAGVPRSGTSWLGKIIDSNPNVAYRFQPIFSYAFKDAINMQSTRIEFQKFLQSIYESEDEFLNQRQQKKDGIYPRFKKNQELSILAFKSVRYHYLLKKFIDYIPNIKILGIIRNPCAVINSFLTNPKEFPEDKDPRKEWRYAECRNDKKEEYWGFEKWKEASNLFLELSKHYPEKFKIISYEDLVQDPFNGVENIFDFINLQIMSQTHKFIEESHNRHIDDPYAVYKSKIVKYKWIWELDRKISRAIISELINTDLEQFIKL